MSINKAMLLGRLGQDPELRYTPQGAPVCSFSLATSESWKDKTSGQKQEKTEWHRIVVWGKLAEFCNQYLNKGKQVFVEGRIQTRAWDDKTGVKRYTTEILASAVQFIGPSTSQNSDSANPNAMNAGGGAPSGDYAPDYGSAPSNSGGNNSAPSFSSSPASFTADDIPF